MNASVTPAMKMTTAEVQIGRAGASASAATTTARTPYAAIMIRRRGSRSAHTPPIGRKITRATPRTASTSPSDEASPPAPSTETVIATASICSPITEAVWLSRSSRNRALAMALTSMRIVAPGGRPVHTGGTEWNA